MIQSTIHVDPLIGDIMIQFRRLWRFTTSVKLVVIR